MRRLNMRGGCEMKHAPQIKASLQMMPCVEARREAWRLRRHRRETHKADTIEPSHVNGSGNEGGEAASWRPAYRIVQR